MKKLLAVGAVIWVTWAVSTPARAGGLGLPSRAQLGRDAGAFATAFTQGLIDDATNSLGRAVLLTAALGGETFLVPAAATIGAVWGLLTGDRSNPASELAAHWHQGNMDSIQTVFSPTWMPFYDGHEAKDIGDFLGSNIQRLAKSLPGQPMGGPVAGPTFGGVGTTR